MNKEQMDELVAQVGKQAATLIEQKISGFAELAKKTAEEAIKNGGVTPEKFKEYQDAAKQAVDDLKEICRKQGVDINEMAEKLQNNGATAKSIGQTFSEHNDELMQVKSNGSGSKHFHVYMNNKGAWVAVPYEPNKKAAPQATIAGIGGGGNPATVAQSIDAATLLRLGGNSPIISQFRNTPWILDLVSVSNAGLDTQLAMWYEEVAKTGGSDLVLEGGTKPGTNYTYELKTDTYKKEAVLVSITDEFSIDFARLESDILGKARIDLFNKLNTRFLTDINSKATAYNTANLFNAGTTGVANANDFDVLAAMAAQVDNATYGNLANAALMSTFKKYRMGITKSTQAEYINRPEVINNLAFVGNPDMTPQQVIVGDLKNYNVIFRGGFIVKVGYNGTDFAENRFSVVLEQYYMNYISAIRRKAIVKGPDFKTVRDLIAAAPTS